MMAVETILRSSNLLKKDYAAKFYAKKKFRYFPYKYDEKGQKVQEPDVNKDNIMTYCETCNILRPPRAFHCK